ncbi:MAG: Xaa-Pro peptidase family protein [Candidatus Thermoplasmatota archaeon]|nr:Xaa-Pro peptidase family protein [Candidatus Thermoplasmatota archaeon]
MFDAVGKKKVDAIVFANAVDPHVDMGFFYLTGFTEGVFERSAAIAYPDGSSTIITSILEETTAKKSKMDVLLNEEKDDWQKNMKKSLGDSDTIGLHWNELTYENYKRIRKALPGKKFVDISNAIGKARMVKDKVEIDATREACRMASIAAEKITKHIVPGVKEYELAAELTYIMQKLGATGNSFDPISSFGPNTAEPHYLAGDAVAKKNDVVLLDFGCKYKKYVSDITRTYFLGKATKEQKEVYAIVQEAQQCGLDAVCAGEDGADVDKKVRAVIDNTKYKGRLIHSTGHSIGLSVHDGGVLNYKLKTPLEEGMLFTIEPGIYLPGKFGVRIEDDVLVTKKGCEVLTSAPKELVEL